MNLLERLFRNHVLVNLAFLLVLVVGLLSYQQLPRQQDPTINFNWIVVTTVMPGASATDMEKRVTDPLEDAVRRVADIKFASSNSREGISSILIRFEEITERLFDKRVADLRREIESKREELPEAARDPVILEITSANAYPTATLAVVGEADDENLRYQARTVRKALERMEGVDRVEQMGLRDPELQVRFDPERLVSLGLSPVTLMRSIQSAFADLAAGTVDVGGSRWLIRVVGSDAAPSFLASIPVIGGGGSIVVGDVAEVERGREKPFTLASLEGQPAIALSVMKKGHANVLDVMAGVQRYIDERNRLSRETGVSLVLVDDQTIPTRQAIAVMQNNAALGLLLVLLVTWLFLGTRIAVLVTIGIPFILAATFWVLSVAGFTLNVMVLLGVVISLGMLVDDAVVVVEAIYYRLQRGTEVLRAAGEGLREVFSPVTSAVLTTMAAFLPLMLLPGILGDFMRVIPVVVTVALAASLLEAYWILPAHVVGARISLRRPGRVQKARWRAIHWLQIRYTRLLLKVMRRPAISLTLLLGLFGAAGVIAGSDLIRKDFFAADTIRMFYVNVEMPPETPLERTMETVEAIAAQVREGLAPEERRAVLAYAGQMFTETAPMFGDHYGQVLAGLHPRREGMRTVEEITEALRARVMEHAGPVNIAFLMLKGGPPTSKPVSVKVKGDRYDEIRRAADDLKALLATIPGVRDITDDAVRGRMELVLVPDFDAIARAGLDVAEVRQALRLLVDGEVIASLQHRGEELDVRLQASPGGIEAIDRLLDLRLPAADGGGVTLRELFHQRREEGLGNIRHYDFRRAITVEADIDPAITDTLSVNRTLQARWEEIQPRYPTLDLDFSGELEDLQESLDAIALLFVFGIGLMYLIIGTQFRSYFQPLMILVSVPMAFTGVILGLLLTQNPLSLYTLYGVVALSGIAVNAAIVLITTANRKLEAGMSLLHATVYAARRRVIPILITSLTTIAGLMSLALGLGGRSLVWGPVATAIVWGLGFSTLLTLFLIPVLYRMSMARAVKDGG